MTYREIQAIAAVMFLSVFAGAWGYEHRQQWAEPHPIFADRYKMPGGSVVCLCRGDGDYRALDVSDNTMRVTKAPTGSDTEIGLEVFQRPYVGTER